MGRSDPGSHLLKLLLPTRPPEQVVSQVAESPGRGGRLPRVRGRQPSRPKRHLVGGCWALREAVVTRLPHIGQSLQLLALLVGDDAIHHHPLGAIQDFGVHGESDAVIQQGATCKAVTRLAKSSSGSDTLHQILSSCKEQKFQLIPVYQRNLPFGHFQRWAEPEDRT